MMFEDSPGWMGKVEHTPQSPLCVFHTWAISLVHHQDVGYLKDASFNSLDLVAHSRRFHHERGMGQPSDVHFGLSSAHRLDHDDLKPGRIENLHHTGRGWR